jgi:hypothetical protein
MGRSCLTQPSRFLPMVVMFPETSGTFCSRHPTVFCGHLSKPFSNLQMNGTDVAGQTISVARATINKPRHDGPDRAGGGRGYGSGGQDRTYGRDYGTSGRNYGDGGRYDDRGAGAGRYEGKG